MMTNPHVLRALIDTAIFLEFSRAPAVDDDAAVSALEQIACHLTAMGTTERDAFRREVSELIGEYGPRQQSFIRTVFLGEEPPPTR